jgi:hypothetical protein
MNATVRLSWKPAFRVLPARTHEGGTFARIAGAADIDALRTLADLTDPLARDAAGAIALCPLAARPAGPIAAAFAYPSAGAFLGVLDAAHDRETALAEAACHLAAFLLATREGPLSLPMRLDLFDIEGDFIDARTDGAGVCPPDDVDGVWLRSARRPGGERVAVFRPAAAQYRGDAAQLLLEWDGEKIAEAYERIPLP